MLLYYFTDSIFADLWIQEDWRECGRGDQSLSPTFHQRIKNIMCPFKIRSVLCFAHLLNFDMVPNTNLFLQMLRVFTNINDVSTSVFDHMRSLLQHCVSYEDECIIYCVSPNLNMYLPRKICPLLLPFQHIIQL